MSFISSIKSYVSKVIGTEETSPVTDTAPAKNQKSGKPVVEGKGTEVGDKGVYSKNPQAVKGNVKALKTAIDNACTRNGVDSNELYRILLSQIGLKNMNEFYTKLTKEQQEMYLGFVGVTIEQAEKYGAKHNKHVDITKAVVVQTQLVLDAAKKNVLKNKKDLQNMTENATLKSSSEALLDNINSLSEADLNACVKNLENDIKTYIQNEKARISKIKDADEQKRQRELLDQKIEFYRDYVYGKVLMKADSERAVGAITIVNSKRLPAAVRSLYATRCSQAEVTRTADMFNQKCSEGIVKQYYEKGDKLSPEIYRNFIHENVKCMSAEAREQLENDYAESRMQYEQNGYPEYMDREMYQSEAVGIVSGTQENINMTAEQKAAAVENFYKTEEKLFHDAETIKEYVSVYNSQKAASESKTNEEPKKSADERQIKAAESYTSKPSENTVCFVQKPFVTQEIGAKFVSVLKDNEPVSPQESNEQINNIKSEIELTHALVTQPFEKVIKEYSVREVANVVFSNSNLKTHLPRLKWYVSSLCPEELKNLTSHCSTEAYFFVLRNISPDKAIKLHDSKKDMCYAERKIGEQIVKSRENNNEIAS